MNKEMICKNCKYHYIEEISFDYPQSCCSKRQVTTEEWLKCNDFEYSDRYIEQLQQENKILKENYEMIYNENCILREKHNINDIDLLDENKQLKEVIDKLDKYINDYNVFEVFSFPLMKRWEEEQVKSSINYEFKTSLIKDLKDILKEVE